MRTTLTRTGPLALDLLGGDPDATAILTPTASVDYAGLAERIADRCAELGTARRLVFLAGSNTLETVVTYLAALAGGHPVLLQPTDAGGSAGLEGLIARYRPDVVVHADADGAAPDIEELAAGSRHAFHPELALLASTSGSTGSPKLVRLSRANVLGNARSIAEGSRSNSAGSAISSSPCRLVNSASIASGKALAADGNSAIRRFCSRIVFSWVTALAAR